MRCLCRTGIRSWLPRRLAIAPEPRSYPWSVRITPAPVLPHRTRADRRRRHWTEWGRCRGMRFYLHIVLLVLKKILRGKSGSNVWSHITTVSLCQSVLHTITGSITYITFTCVTTGNTRLYVKDQLTFSAIMKDFNRCWGPNLKQARRRPCGWRASVSNILRRMPTSNSKGVQQRLWSMTVAPWERWVCV